MEVDNMNPCENCTRVPDPGACDKKDCQDWQAYWIPRWDQTCLDIFRKINEQVAESEKEKVQT